MDVLLQVANPVILGKGDLPGSGIFLSQENAEQGGFAITVAANQPNPFARSHLKRDIFKQHLMTVVFVQPLDRDHRISKAVNLTL
jgi:hypothetical protein